jgi:single-strand DNA-binding protein
VRTLAKPRQRSRRPPPRAAKIAAKNQRNAAGVRRAISRRMTQGLNKVMLFGNLGADPELRMTASGTHVLAFRVATTDIFYDKNQQKQEKTEWHHVALFGPRAEPLSKLMSKGSRVLVEGRLQTTSYDKDGSKRYKTEIIATDLFLAGAARDSASLAREHSGNGRDHASGLRSHAAASALEESDVPF